MAKNFVDAVNEHRARLDAVQAVDPNDIVAASVQAAANVLVPHFVKILKQNNVELARVLRNNPVLTRKP